MEVLIECFFDQVFSELDRGSLIPRYKRKQLVDYFSTIIYGCCKGEENCDAQTGCRRAVESAIRYHESMREKNREVCMLGKYHSVLYVAVKICFDWKLQDASTITRLLNNIYMCENTFERLFEGAIFGPKITHLISGWKSDFNNRAENMEAIVYFLDHAINGRLTFFSHGALRRLIDVPMTSYNQMTPAKIAAQAGQCDVLTLLVRYGARLSDENHITKFCPFQPIFYKLNACCEEDREFPPEFLNCLDLLLRAVERVPFYYFQDFGVGEEDLATIHPSLIDQNIVPADRCGFEPPLLKHLSRCAVRQALNDSWKLPYGIENLDVPDSIKQYLDLQLD